MESSQTEIKVTHTHTQCCRGLLPGDTSDCGAGRGLNEAAVCLNGQRADQNHRELPLAHEGGCCQSERVKMSVNSKCQQTREASVLSDAEPPWSKCSDPQKSHRVASCPAVLGALREVRAGTFADRLCVVLIAAFPTIMGGWQQPELLPGGKGEDKAWPSTVGRHSAIQRKEILTCHATEEGRTHISTAGTYKGKARSAPSHGLPAGMRPQAVPRQWPVGWGVHVQWALSQVAKMRKSGNGW